MPAAAWGPQGPAPKARLRLGLERPDVARIGRHFGEGDRHAHEGMIVAPPRFEQQHRDAFAGLRGMVGDDEDAARLQRVMDTLVEVGDDKIAILDASLVAMTFFEWQNSSQLCTGLLGCHNQTLCNI